MAWIEVHQALRDHRKLLALADELNLPEPHAAGHVIYLWLWALDSAPDGVLPASERIIERAAYWEGERGAFVAALVSSGLADRDEDGRLHLHDWADYGGKVIAQRQANARRQADWRDRQRTPPPPTTPPAAPDPALRNGRAAQHRPLRNDDVTVTSPSRNVLENNTVQDTTPQDLSPPRVDLAERERDSRRETIPAHTREGQADSPPRPPLSLSRQASLSRGGPHRPHRPQPPDAVGYSPDYSPLADALAGELGFAPPRDWLPRLANGGLTPETVPKVCRLYRETFGAGIPLTPRALHNNLPHLLAKVNGHGDPAQRAARRAAAEEEAFERERADKARMVRELQDDIASGRLTLAVS